MFAYLTLYKHSRWEAKEKERLCSHHQIGKSSFIFFFKIHVYYVFATTKQSLPTNVVKDLYFSLDNSHFHLSKEIMNSF